ncbi:flavin-containing monooxygenase [Aestuariirhabdus litorea]|uniref:NAD(P)/FAD-dependent oxidoreductase n=1 Tax=Aestuariirhabdus litorea TaxID=2528527 RepID=A0A3P3VKG3_9GAMM|nr:NAD(P)/FAD-dependent oxidoreductase [Aestuariirhabdus litorea]RRJ83222.1 NAD(P)/FAD-dependent oxidoreductase [Aestuariirhabdus litorea]RWW93379.1 NAD(P)/FAD-dependent oxidoreductase [Endozoicomonadaceae bacterium GTF-13]
MTRNQRRDPRVVIIGAGMSGILMTIKLREAGITDICVLEKGESVGGTWRENRYPGLACDIPAHMYTYAFEPNPEWEHRFARGPEIRRYFEQVADKYDVVRDVRFNEAVERCVYEGGVWHLTTSKGAELEADLVISATGILHHPAYPDIEGLEQFEGECFHTARWPDKLSLKGKRVGIIGTGSTAAQVIPELVKEAGQVVVFQRTPQWIYPAPDREYDASLRAKVRKNPRLARRAYRWYTRAIELFFSRAVIGQRIPHFLMSWACRQHLKRKVKDPELRRRLTPDYTVGCKRVIVSTKFYDAIQAPNCRLVTEGIERVDANGVVTADGQHHGLDLLVLATGFHPFNFMRPMELVGRDGLHINKAWVKRVQAYRSLLIPGFPNFFLMLGPNTPIGNFSVIAMSEVQSHYLLQLIERWRRGEVQEIEATTEATERFNQYLRGGMAHTVWVGGCNSWYLDNEGVPAMWPYTWGQWVKEMSAPQWSDFTQGAGLSREARG